MILRQLDEAKKNVEQGLGKKSIEEISSLAEASKSYRWRPRVSKHSHGRY